MWLPHGNKLQASWKSRDLESNIVKTEFCVGTVPVGCQVKSMTELSLNSTNVTCDDCQLHHQGTYYVTVRVTNGAGASTLRTTEKVKVDFTPPFIADVIPVTEVTHCITNCVLTANVTFFGDEETGVRSCNYAIKNSTHFITNYTNNGLNNKIEAQSLHLVPGEKYYVTARCENNAGLVAEKVSTIPVMVDDTPPTKVTSCFCVTIKDKKKKERCSQF